jgi:hypothetical protein
MTTQARVCFRKILQRDLPHAAAHGLRAELFKPQDSQKASKIQENHPLAQQNNAQAAI